jgi:hypothetical protein
LKLLLTPVSILGNKAQKFHSSCLVRTSFSLNCFLPAKPIFSSVKQGRGDYVRIKSWIYSIQLRFRKCYLLLNLSNIFVVGMKQSWQLKKNKGGRAGNNAGERFWGKGLGEWTLCNKMFTRVSKCKNDTCWNCSSNWGRERWRRMVEEVNSCMMYLTHCNDLCKCHNVPQSITTIKGKKVRFFTLYTTF